ncbi:MAG: hypothetical protein P4L53_25705 [Candidatus Obscuribacterales bacterium]|nr:hypothetical protein [Candidatus Obscuribacterales bacterium]
MRNSCAWLFTTILVVTVYASISLSAHCENNVVLSQPQKAKVDVSKPHSTMLLDGGVTTQAEQIQWLPWHETFDKAVIENQTELLKHNRAIRYGLAVVEYKVTRDRQLTVRALPHDDPTYKQKAAEALSNYSLDALRKDLYLAPNEKFDALVVKCYERLNNKRILAFPDNSERNEVSDVRWHIAGVGVGNYVHSRTDDYEQIVGQ